MATATLNDGTAVWAYPVFLGLGLGIALSNVTTVAQLSAAPALIAVTSGLLAGVRAFGGSIALPIFSSIFNSTVSKHLAVNIAGGVLPLGLSPKYLPQFAEALAAQDKEALAKIPGVNTAVIAAGLKAVKVTYLLGYRYVWITSAIFSAAGVIAACFLLQPKKDMNMHVDAPLDDKA